MPRSPLPGSGRGTTSPRLTETTVLHLQLSVGGNHGWPSKEGVAAKPARVFQDDQLQVARSSLGHALFGHRFHNPPSSGEWVKGCRGISLAQQVHASRDLTTHASFVGEALDRLEDPSTVRPICLTLPGDRADGPHRDRHIPPPQGAATEHRLRPYPQPQPNTNRFGGQALRQASSPGLCIAHHRCSGRAPCCPATRWRLPSATIDLPQNVVSSWVTVTMRRSGRRCPLTTSVAASIPLAVLDHRKEMSLLNCVGFPGEPKEQGGSPFTLKTISCRNVPS